jgi:hypothetical protein
MRCVTSTHDGKSNVRECKAVIACSGFGAVVETANITAARV